MRNIYLHSSYFHYKLQILSFKFLSSNDDRIIRFTLARRGVLMSNEKLAVFL